ncbi:hypothetical protein [Streptomyces hainanensis]|uniref:Uncharacterized protein n=1 Tax=Streptomyces hainanensis TaxID=402648 RepID=A0A4R4T8Y7_9ACTN|nr:hypothetical protein [Streptomyces hainanensis]TDC73661.1 hypothetical protein E1283_18600 [Streptomyces hainanensis]
MPDLAFTREDVQATAGRRPWERRREFTAEIDPDDMADTAAAYARAAEEGATAANIAERATRVATEAGEWDGESLVDGQGRIRDTQQDLRPEELEGVTHVLVRAMNEAIVAEEVVAHVIEGGEPPVGAGELVGGREARRAGRGLEDRYLDHLRAATTEWNGWVDALGTAVYGTRTWEYDTPPTVNVQYDGRWRQVPPSTGADGVPTYSPDHLAPEIRERHLRAAADDAVVAADDIEGAIDAYRSHLTELSMELSTRGYDLSEGPLHLFVNDDMAAWSADQLRELLANAGEYGPDRELLLQYLSGVEGVVLGVYDDEYADHPAPARRLTDAELSYLETFYGRLDPETLAAIGRANWANGATTDEEMDYLTNWGDAAMRFTSDGLLMLLNPEIGGHDPARDPGAVPDAVAPYVYDHAARLRGASEESVADFSSFGDLMGQSRVAGGQAFSEDLGRAAVAIEPLTADLRHEGSENPVNTGTRELLDVTGRRPEAAAALVGDPDFTRSLMNGHYAQPYDIWGTEWDGGREWKVVGLVERATTLPAGVDPASDQGRAHADAAYAYLSYLDSPDASGRNNDGSLALDVHKRYAEIDPARFARFEDVGFGPLVD